MASLKHNIEYAAARIGVALARLFPARIADWLAAGLGTVAYYLITSRRRVALENLEAAFGNEMAPSRRKEVTRGVFRSIARTLIEMARFRNLGLEGIKRIVTDEHVDRALKAYEEGHGGIILTAHFGNWEMLGVYFQAIGIPMDYLVATQSNEKVNRLLNSLRSDLGVGIIPVGAGAKGIFKALRNGHFAGLAADQHAPAESVLVDFFGRKASVAKGPSLFALRCKSPIFPCVLVRERYNRHRLISDEPIYPPLIDDEEESVRYMVTRYIRFLEKCIREYPHLWMWTHKRWKPIKKAGNRTLKVT